MWLSRTLLHPIMSQLADAGGKSDHKSERKACQEPLHGPWRLSQKRSVGTAPQHTRLTPVPPSGRGCKCPAERGSDRWSTSRTSEGSDVVGGRQPPAARAGPGGRTFAKIKSGSRVREGAAPSRGPRGRSYAAQPPRHQRSIQCPPPPPPEGCPPPPPPGPPAYAQPLSPWRQVPGSTAVATDSNRPQPLRQPPPTACLTASGAASEVPSLLTHPLPPPPPTDDEMTMTSAAGQFWPIFTAFDP